MSSGNPQSSRKVICPKCRHERTTSSQRPFCKNCRQNMVEMKPRDAALATLLKRG